MRVQLTAKLSKEVADYREASEAARTFIGSHGVSQCPSGWGLITDEDGKTIAHVSYNGKVWPGTAWEPGMEPLYTPKIGDLKRLMSQ